LGRSSPGLALGAAVVVLGVLAARRTFRWPDPGVQIVGLSAVGVLAAMAVAWAATDGPGRWIVRVLGVRPLRWLGQVSYVAYLIHQPILQINIGLEGKATWLGTWTAGRTFVASAGLTLIGAWLSWVVLEKPILRLRLRLEAAAGRVKPTLW
jgi:peptidoglycan/LPS O-acetylase OafA/YrhL